MEKKRLKEKKMSRSKWKGPLLTVNSFKDGPTRAVSVVPFFIGKTFKIHNGCKQIQIKISSSMIGHRFGEFVFTKKPIHLKKGL